MKTTLFLKITLVISLVGWLFFAVYKSRSPKKTIEETNPTKKVFSIPTKEFELNTELKPVFTMPKQTNILGLDSAAFYQEMTRN